MEFVRARKMERLARGVYATPDAWVDEMYMLSLRSHRVVFSHESALLLHGLAEREPEAPTVTLPSGYNASALRRDGVRVYFIKADVLSLGRIELPAPDGNIRVPEKSFLLPVVEL
jgi:predicted transcriptional regulator of viral defense system